MIPLTSNEDEDAVRLMTAHGAKGLEFAHVFILRATSGSFPPNYRETLVEFPRELRDPDSAVSQPMTRLSTIRKNAAFSTWP